MAKQPAKTAQATETTSEPTAAELAAAEAAQKAAAKFKGADPIQTKDVAKEGPSKQMSMEAARESSSREVSDKDLVKLAKKQGLTVFRSHAPEPGRFEIKLRGQQIRSTYAPDPQFLEWHVPAHLVDAMRTHLLVRSGRIVELTG